MQEGPHSDEKEFAASADQVESDVEEERIQAKTPEEKFKIIHPTLDRIAEMLVRYGTERVMQYGEELKMVERNIREGRAIFDCGKGARFHTVPDSESTKESKDQGDTEEVSEDQGKWNLKFMAKPASRGRPRGSGSKVKFVSRKGKVPEQHRSKSMPVNAPQRAENTPLVCTFPPNRVKRDAIYTADYLTLAPRQYVQDVIIDFKLRYMQPSGPEGEEVWLMSSQLGQLIGQIPWTSHALLRAVDQARPWQERGCRFVVLPWCESAHYFLLVAVLDPQPMMFILESMGGCKEPAGAEILRNCLMDQRVLQGGPKVPFLTYTPTVPKQPSGSNDCGLFVLEFTREIMRDPEDFLRRAEAGTLSDWFPTAIVQNRRQELAALLRQLGEEQRRPGEVLEDQPALLLPDFTVEKVKKSQRLRIRRNPSFGFGFG